MEQATGSGEPRQVHYSQSSSSTTGGGSKPAQGSIGACDACRARKVRCLANENSMSSKCQRCERARRECLYTPHSKTRRRKRTDTRVRELEEKVKSLSVLLEHGRPSPPQPSPHGEEDETKEDSEDSSDEGEAEEDEDVDAPFDITASYNGASNLSKGSTAFATNRRNATATCGPRNTVPIQKQPSGAQGGKRYSKSSPQSQIPDVVDKGMLSMAQATELFDRYVNVLSPHYPAVILPAGTTATEVRDQRPILFLALVAAGAGNAEPSLNLKLNQEILQVYANEIALGGRKSLDLVQSLLVSTLWYYPPDRFEELRFHQFIHMAATMALDIGLGKRPRPPREDSTGVNPSNDFAASMVLGYGASFQGSSSSIEAKRTLLACYLSCASVSMSLRLPNMLRFTNYMGDCLLDLETSPDAAPTDRRLAALVRIQRIAEEAVLAFSLDDPSSTASLYEERTQHMLQGYKEQLDDWRRVLATTPALNNGFLQINFHVSNGFIHEIALHPDHDPEDFRPPFYISTTPISKDTRGMSPAYVSAIMECVTSSKAVLDAFLSIETAIVRALPALLYVRIIYSCVVLVKLEISSQTPSSELGRVLDGGSLEVRSYLDRTLRHLIDIVGMENKNILAAKFLLILKKLVPWYRNQQQRFEAGADLGQGVCVEPTKTGTETANTVFSDAALEMDPPRKTPGLPSFVPAPGSMQPFSGIGHRPLTPAKLYASDFNHPPSAVAGFGDVGYDPQPVRNSNAGYSPSDMSSPEPTNPRGSTLPYDVNDADMFGYLQDAQPFQWSQNPNEWIFDGVNYGNLQDFEWGSLQ